jgi:hypothetical protein
MNFTALTIELPLREVVHYNLAACCSKHSSEANTKIDTTSTRNVTYPRKGTHDNDNITHL